MYLLPEVNWPQRNSAAKCLEGSRDCRKKMDGRKGKKNPWSNDRERETTTAVGSSRDESETTKLPLQFGNNYQNDIPAYMPSAASAGLPQTATSLTS